MQEVIVNSCVPESVKFNYKEKQICLNIHLNIIRLKIIEIYVQLFHVHHSEIVRLKFTIEFIITQPVCFGSACALYRRNFLLYKTKAFIRKKKKKNFLLISNLLRKKYAFSSFPEISTLSRECTRVYAV